MSDKVIMKGLYKMLLRKATDENFKALVTKTINEKYADVPTRIIKCDYCGIDIECFSECNCGGYEKEYHRRLQASKQLMEG